MGSCVLAVATSLKHYLQEILPFYYTRSRPVTFHHMYWQDKLNCTFPLSRKLYLKQLLLKSGQISSAAYLFYPFPCQNGSLLLAIAVTVFNQEVLQVSALPFPTSHLQAHSVVRWGAVLTSWAVKALKVATHTRFSLLWLFDKAEGF